MTLSVAEGVPVVALTVAVVGELRLAALDVLLEPGPEEEEEEEGQPSGKRSFIIHLLRR